jgi:hypothetical protein
MKSKWLQYENIRKPKKRKQSTPALLYFDNREFHDVLTILSFQIVAFIEKNSK